MGGSFIIRCVWEKSCRMVCLHYVPIIQALNQFCQNPCLELACQTGFDEVICTDFPAALDLAWLAAAKSRPPDDPTM
jgi:hypothetical protein